MPVHLLLWTPLRMVVNVLLLLLARNVALLVVESTRTCSVMCQYGLMMVFPQSMDSIPLAEGPTG
jgi:hypothetical protein